MRSLLKGLCCSETLPFLITLFVACSQKVYIAGQGREIVAHFIQSVMPQHDTACTDCQIALTAVVWGIKGPIASTITINIFCSSFTVIHFSEYEIVSPYEVNHRGVYISHEVAHHHRRRRRSLTFAARSSNSDGGSETVHFRLSGLGQDFHMELREASHSLIAPGFTIQVLGKNGTKSRRTYQQDELCFYQGSLRSRVNSSVALSTCMGMVSLNMHIAVLHKRFEWVCVFNKHSDWFFIWVVLFHHQSLRAKFIKSCFPAKHWAEDEGKVKGDIREGEKLDYTKSRWNHCFSLLDIVIVFSSAHRQSQSRPFTLLLWSLLSRTWVRPLSKH